MRKLLVVVSSLDLRAPLSSTPSWWQLLKALSEQQIELVVAPYQGPRIESPWWTAAPNPCQLEGDAVGFVKRFTRPRVAPSRTAVTEPSADRLTRALVDRVTKPRWRRQLVRMLERDRAFDGVLFLSVPPNHFGGIARLIKERFSLPTYFYDGDVPASLPRFAGFRTGFRIYQGADLSEYAAVFSSSKGGVDDLVGMGARDVRVLYYAADPALFSPSAVEVDQDLDVFFYGHGAEYRESWITAMLDEPSREMSVARFAVRGTYLGNLPNVQRLPYASFSKLSDYCRRSRVNLLITRQAHTSVYGSSTARPFELAALGCAMVSNPYLGIEEWFEPDREILIVDDAQHAIRTYRRLLADSRLRRELGERARQRFLAEHTYGHRARQFLAAIGWSAGPPRSVLSATAQVRDAAAARRRSGRPDGAQNA